MAVVGPPLGRPDRRGPPRRDGRASWPSSSTTTGSPSPPTPTSSTASRCSAGTPSTSGSTRPCPASASPGTSGRSRRAPCPGGEQTRAALARLVIADPDLLMLDEPTNHLDLDALEWLEEHLRRRAGSLIVASHDRAFLDATVTRVWELRDRRLTAFRGDYIRVPPPADRARRPPGEGRRDPGRVDRPRAGARPALPEPSQVRQDARARGAPRAAPLRADRDAQGRPPAASSAARRWPGRVRPAPARSSSGSRTSSSATCPASGGRPYRPAPTRHRGTARRRARRRGWREPRRARPPSPSRWPSPASRSWPPSAASGSGSSVRTAPARRPCCGRSPVSCRRSTGS